MADAGPNEGAGDADLSDFDIVNDVLGKSDSDSHAGDSGDDGDGVGGDDARDDAVALGGADDDGDPDDVSAADDSADERDTDDDVDDTAGEAITNVRKAIKGKDFKKAFELLGVEPADLELDEKAWTAWRAANAREHKKLKASEQAAIQRLSGWDQKLRQEQAELAKAQQELSSREERAAPIVKALEEYERSGDPTHIVAIVEKATGKPYDEAQKDILHKVRRSPGERRLEQKLEEALAKLAKLEGGAEPEKPQQDPQAVVQQEIQWVTQQTDQAIAQGLVHGDAKKVPHFAQRIRNLLIKTKGPVGLTMTVDAAARQILKAERKRLQTHPLARPPSATQTPPPTRGKGKGGDPPLRRDSRNDGTGVRDREKETNEDIISSVLARAKATRRAG